MTVISVSPPFPKRHASLCLKAKALHRLHFCVLLFLPGSGAAVSAVCSMAAVAKMLRAPCLLVFVYMPLFCLPPPPPLSLEHSSLLCAWLSMSESDLKVALSC